MKKKLAMLLAALLLVSAFSACGKTETPSSALASSEAAMTPSPKPTEAPTPSPEPSAVSTPSSDLTLSDDIYSFQLEMGGVVYQFPMTYAAFTSHGWVCKEDDTQGVRSNAYSGVSFEKDGYSLYVDIINFDINELPMNQCYIGGVTADTYKLSDKLPETFDITLPGGITLNKSNNEEVVAAYGTPSRETKLDSGSIYIDYEKESYQVVNLAFYAEEAGDKPLVLTSIEVRNHVAPEDFQSGEVNTEVPAIVTKYQAPAALSAEFDDWTVKFAGKLYQLPAPVSEFEADGWVIDASVTEMTVNGRGNGWVQMMKDNQKMEVLTTNYSEGATSIQNCFVTNVYADVYNCKVELEISKGIHIGMKEADLVAAIGALEYEKTDSSSFIYYEVRPTDSRIEDYQITISKETGLISKIKVSFAPKYADYTAG